MKKRGRSFSNLSSGQSAKTFLLVVILALVDEMLSQIFYKSV
jgi:hypothetical protein